MSEKPTSDFDSATAAFHRAAKLIKEFQEQLEELVASKSDVALRVQIEHLRAAIRKHRDQRGDDRCWRDDEELYAVLPEGYTPPARDTAVELKNCERFIACRQNPATKYVSPEREIEQLRREKKARIYYQNLVYLTCIFADRVLGLSVTNGTGVVCGTLETPSSGLQEAIAQILEKIKRWERIESVAWDIVKIKNLPAIPAVVYNLIICLCAALEAK